MPIRAVFFDLDGTLLDHDTAERAGALAFHSHFRTSHADTIEADPDVFCERWAHVLEQQFNRWMSGQIEYQAMRRARVREMLGDLDDGAADDAFAIYRAGYTGAWQAYADVADCLATLREAGYRLGVITNGIVPNQSAKLETIGLGDAFETVVISAAYGANKPDAGIFHHACDQLGLPPTEACYIGDKLDGDALGAHDAGLFGIWLNRSGGPPPDPHRDRAGDVPTLRDLTGLPALVAGCE